MNDNGGTPMNDTTKTGSDRLKATLDRAARRAETIPDSHRTISKQKTSPRAKRLAKLTAERDEARAKLAEVRALAETWRYKGAYGGDPRLEDGPDEEGRVLDSASGELLDILDAPDAGVSREATP